MRIADLLTICLLAVVTLSAIYAPQPVLPLMAREFGVGQTAVSLVVTLTLLPLGVAPLVYGIVLERVSPRSLLRLSTLLLAVSELAVYAAASLWLILALRFVQGLLIAAVLTGMMTHLSQASAEAEAGPGRPMGLQQAMALYVGATIFGGFFGRFLAGLLSGWFGWRSVFLALFAALALCAALLGGLRSGRARPEPRPLSPGLIADVLRRPGYLRCYTMIFCCFFVFASLLNVLPFRLAELSPAISTLRIALTYSGYLMGILISLTTVRLIRLARGELRLVLAGLGVYLLALVLFLPPSLPVFVASMFLFCTGMFTVHNVAPGYLNRHTDRGKGVVNGLYVSFYYTGGTLGSFLPGLIYQHAGWEAYLACLAAMVGVAFWASSGLQRVGGKS
jgi:YNFM family putative membrane transporter